MSLVSFSLAGFVAMNFVGRSALLAQDICDVPWRLEETLRIGSLDGDDALSGVLDLEIGPDGEIYVAQQFVPRVTVFTAEGRLDRTIGRAGSGPGEFDMGPTRLGWFGDMLWVSDLSVTHFFRSDGTEARQVAFAAPMYEEGSRFMPGRPLADGSFLGNRHVVFRRGYGSFFEMEQLTVPRFSDKGAVVDTIMTVSQRAIVSGFNAAHPLDSWHGDAGWLPLVATIDGSSVIVVGDVREDGPSPSFDLLRLGLSGDTLLRRSVPYEPTPVTRAERAWLTDGFSAAMAGDYLSGPGLPTSDSQRERMRRDARDAIAFPENHPPVRQIVAGQDGSIWLLREFALPDLVDRWEIYDSEGSLEGTVLIRGGRSLVEPWQPRLNVHRATRDEIWGTTIDDLEVPYIHRYRVDRSCPS